MIGYPSGQVEALARSAGLPARKNSSELSYIINLKLAKLVRSRWLDIVFLRMATIPSRPINTTRNKDLGEHPRWSITQI